MKNRTTAELLVLTTTLWIGGVAVSGVHAGPVTFLNDYEGFLAAAGDVRTIDFETLPDGSPSHVGVPITPDFNYTDQGVTFSSPTGDPFIAGNPVSGFELLADAYNEQQETWITADLDPHVSAIGVFFVGQVHSSVYGTHGDLLSEVTYFPEFGNGPPYFLGIVSDEAISRAIVDNLDDIDYTAGILDFVYTPVPEPTTLIILAFGVLALARTQLRR